MWRLIRVCSVLMFLAAGVTLPWGLRAGNEQLLALGVGLVAAGLAVEGVWQRLRNRRAGADAT